jgi:two-component system sensor histidine kinase KdpD
MNWLLPAGAVLLVGQTLWSMKRAQAAHRRAERERSLRKFGEQLRDAPSPTAQAEALQRRLQEFTGCSVSLALRRALPTDPDAVPELNEIGQLSAEQRAGIRYCLDGARSLGPGTGREEAQPFLYLPLQGRDLVLGVAVLASSGGRRLPPWMLSHAERLCGQCGFAVERRLERERDRDTRERAQAQALNNALLAAISHDYRTPLATIMGAATSLETQSDKLSLAQRQQLAQGIVEEVSRLARLTDNTLQLARLGAPGMQLRCDWESAEEIVATALRRVRRRPEGSRVHAHVEPGLPLLWCDALLVSQLLDNLVDNALKYSAADAPVELLVHRAGADALLAVRDRGPGIEPAFRERVFEVFKRGDAGPQGARAGAGVGLAVCRAIAEAHAGSLKLRPRGHGGTAFEFRLPLRDVPAMEEV